MMDLLVLLVAPLLIKTDWISSSKQWVLREEWSRYWKADLLLVRIWRHSVSCDLICQRMPPVPNSPLLHQYLQVTFIFSKSGGKVQVPDKGVAVTRPPMDKITLNFACRGFCGLLLNFGQLKDRWPLWRPNLFWPPNVICLCRSHQNFKSFGPLGAELQAPPCLRTHILLPPFQF